MSTTSMKRLMKTLSMIVAISTIQVLVVDHTVIVFVNVDRPVVIVEVVGEEHLYHARTSNILSSTSLAICIILIF